MKLGAGTTIAPGAAESPATQDMPVREGADPEAAEAGTDGSLRQQRHHLPLMLLLLLLRRRPHLRRQLV